MIENTNSPQLRKALEHHREETKNHASRRWVEVVPSV